MAVRPPDPPLTDGLVTLRPWGEAGDTEVLVDACNDPEIARYLDAIPYPYTRTDAKQYLAVCRAGWQEGSIFSFAILVEGQPVGSISIRLVDPDQGVGETGYWVAAQARGNDTATRAVRLLSPWGLEQRGLQRLQLRAAEENGASQRVAEKAGFTREGVLRSSHYNPRLGKRVDWVMYSLLPSDLDA